MKKIAFNITFWDGFDSHNRIKNINFCFEKLKSFVNYANKCEDNIEYCAFLFDFSSEKVLDGSIFIPFEHGTYRRSEKINKVIEYNHNNNINIFCLLDSDIFFFENQYDDIIKELKSIDENKMLINDIIDISHSQYVDYINKTLIFPTEVSIRKVRGLGGFYFVSLDKIFDIGGYDERFTVWGGEDDDMVDRMIRNGCERYISNLKIYHLPHKNMMFDAHKTIEYQEQCKLIGNNDIITKHSLITTKYIKK